jgi:predicted dinucleotide-binding enzyme
MKSFSYARRSDKISRSLARDALGNARAATPGEAAKRCGRYSAGRTLVRIDDVLKQTGDLSGKVIVTCYLPMDAGNTKLIIGTTTAGAEELAKKVPRAHFSSGFQHRFGEVPFGVFESKGKETRPSLV